MSSLGESQRRLGLVASVFLDAFVVRTVLLPAVLQIPGRRVGLARLVGTPLARIAIDRDVGAGPAFEEGT